MDLRQLSYFLSVVDTGSFSRAPRWRSTCAAQLGRQVALLEADSGSACS
jgi:DNA-binding transcriptional LysR family regulator